MNCLLFETVLFLLGIAPRSRIVTSKTDYVKYLMDLVDKNLVTDGEAFFLLISSVKN